MCKIILEISVRDFTAASLNITKSPSLTKRGYDPMDGGGRIASGTAIELPRGDLKPKINLILSVNCKFSKSPFIPLFKGGSDYGSL